MNCKRSLKAWVFLPGDINGSLHEGRGRQCWQLVYSGDRSVKLIFQYIYRGSTPKTRMRRKYNRFIDWFYPRGNSPIRFDDESEF